MPKEVKKKVTVTEYVCSNCGAVHRNKNNFYTCVVTGEEICDKCKEDVNLMEIGSPCVIGCGSDYEVYLSNYPTPVKKELVELTTPMYAYEVDDYRTVVTKLYADFCKKMQEAHKAYLAGKIRDLL